MTAPEAASIKPMRDCGKNARDPDAGREIKWRYAYGSRYQVIREFVGGAAFNSWCGFECRNLAVAKRARRADSALKSWGILDPDHVVLPLVEAQGIHLDVKHFAAKWRGARRIGGPRRARCAPEARAHRMGWGAPSRSTSLRRRCWRAVLRAGRQELPQRWRHGVRCLPA